MSLFIFLTVVQGIIAAALVGLVLMQRSEGGGLGIGGGGSPGGLMSARGAADFLTRTTKWLAVAVRGAGDRPRRAGGGRHVGSRDRQFARPHRGRRRPTRLPRLRAARPVGRRAPPVAPAAGSPAETARRKRRSAHSGAPSAESSSATL